MMQVDQNNDPILLDELPAINGYVSSIVRTSSDTFITGSQDCTFRGWEIRDDQFIGNFNILTEAPIKCVSINQDHTLTGKSNLREISLGEIWGRMEDKSFKKCLALGLENGNVELYQADITEDWKFHSRIQVHNAEVLCLSWKQNFLATGGRDRFVHVIEIDPTSQLSPTKTSVPLDIHTSIVTAVHWMKG